MDASASALAQAIVDTVRELLLVLDSNLRVVVASRSFYAAFHLNAKDVVGRSIYDLAGGKFDIPALRPLLVRVVPDDSTVDAFELEGEFPGLGRRTFVLNARKIFFAGNGPRDLLLAFEDITERRIIEREREALRERAEVLLQEKDMLLQEMQHRVANSLQIIAGILLMKARSVSSEETRQHLQDAHQRVMSVATVQQHIQAAGRGDVIEVGPYLKKLCDSLETSMVGDHDAISLEVVADSGTVVSAHAVSLGLIVTELVINALKHAFPKDYPNARVRVSYETAGSNWQLVVSDNGVGRPIEPHLPTKGGLGITLVNALALQLGAQLEITSTSNGVSVSITYATFNSRLPQAA
jgi:chemotaxis protein methyltransferase CheR